ncbi:hypothetical protein VitviT2T_020011 [Vitis vinifera]|uniref:Helicase ATP-binding domain-containing protein n=1 Tax=Vitis vinifera TaxID=29760 RepID=A0ABY9D2P3_VITVI|nr:hypothetical protein VitviT2T_020011 [Vitis vinifera]
MILNPPYVTLEGGLRIPESIFSKLFYYQKVEVQWLWELHCQQVGGIIGDEMGLGKTIHVLSFLGALHFSNMYKPSINRVLRSQSRLLITTYEPIRLQAGKLLDIKRGYAILDEEHRIRNSNAEVTILHKQLQTVHRIITTGASIQNKLAELWSLFDFIFPGKLRVLHIFEAEFAVPIFVGGYGNASPLQVSTVYRLTNQYDEKLYKVIVAIGSSRSNILGEANIILADYSIALKPYIVALPLHGCNSESVLHVIVKMLTSKNGFREFEQQMKLRERGLQMNTRQNKRDGSNGGEALSSKETVNEHMDKISARVRFKPELTELPSLEEDGGLNDEYFDSTIGFDGSLNTSESLCAEQHDTSSTHEIDSLKSIISGDLNGLSYIQSPQTEKGDPSDQRFLAQGSNDWVHGWSPDYSANNDWAIAYEENNRIRRSSEVVESSIIELKLEVSSL